MTDIDSLFQDLDDFVNPKKEKKKKEGKKKKDNMKKGTSSKSDKIDSLLKDLDMIEFENSSEQGISCKQDQDLDDLDVFLDSMNSLASPVKPDTEKLTFKSPLPKKSNMKTRCKYPSIGTSSESKDFINKNGGVKENCRCPNLRCIRCNFSVKIFDHFEWNNSVDYMFFRLNFPEKVNSKLRMKRGSSCYACQCCWINVKDCKKVYDCANISNNWVCSGH